MAVWAGHPVVLALLLLTVAGASAPATTAREELLVTLGGDVVARYGLEDGASVTLRYRNSLYESVAEERFRLDDGRLRLTALAADERAVLDEYYVTSDLRATEGHDPRPWEARPRDALAIDRLAIAATDLGQRTLLVPGHAPLELWRLVDDRRPTVTLELRHAP